MQNAPPQARQIHDAAAGSSLDQCVVRLDGVDAELSDIIA